MNINPYGLCIYSNPPSGPLCATEAIAQIRASMSELGNLSNSLLKHQTTLSTTNSQEVGVGQVSAGPVMAAGSVQSCILCLANNEINMPQVSFFPTSIWTHAETFTLTCPASNGAKPSGIPTGYTADYCQLYPWECTDAVGPQ